MTYEEREELATVVKTQIGDSLRENGKASQQTFERLFEWQKDHNGQGPNTEHAILNGQITTLVEQSNRLIGKFNGIGWAATILGSLAAALGLLAAYLGWAT